MPGPRGKENPFVASLNGLLPQLQLFGAVNSLAQVVLKIAVPGIPDFYQGNELWELNLVDPDNRRPVDYRQRAGYLDALHALAEQGGPCRGVPRRAGQSGGWPGEALDHASRLQLRRREHALFRRGEYVALEVAGERQENVIAFLRRDAASERSVLAVLPRFACTLMRGKLNCLSARLGATISCASGFAGDALYECVHWRNCHRTGAAKLPLSTLLGTYRGALESARDEDCVPS